MNSGMKELSQLETVLMQINRKSLEESSKVKEETQYMSKKAMEAQYKMQN